MVRGRRSADAGAALSGHRGIDHISFVGSTTTGRSIMRAAADNLVPVKLELGGKSPNILFADADLDTAIPAIVASITENAGQNCYAGSRLVVQESVADEVRERVVAAMRAVRVGGYEFDDAVAALHKAIARSRQTVADGVRCLDLERMGAQVEVFSQALELDLIHPDDF